MPNEDPQHGGWDFTAALNFINAGRADDSLGIGDHETLSPPSLTHSESSERSSEEAESIQTSLGNFDKLWQYLGTSAPTASLADLLLAEQEPGKQTNFNKEPKSVKWRDERLESIAFEGPAFSLEALLGPIPTKQQRKKERRRLRKLTEGQEDASAGNDDGGKSLGSLGSSRRRPHPVSDGETENDRTKLAFKRSKERQGIIQAIVADSPVKSKKPGPATAHDLFLHQVAAKQSSGSHNPPRYDLRSKKDGGGISFTSSDSASALDKSFNKKKELLQLLYARFQTDWRTLAGLNYSYNTPHAIGKILDPTGIHVFVDISNILIGLHDALKLKMGLSRHAKLPRQKLSFYNLSMVLERGRPAAKRCLAGSDMLECIEEARNIGYETNILERVMKEKVLTPRQRFFKARDRAERSGASSGGEATSGPGSGTEDEFKTVTRRVEQAVDEILHLNMMLSIVDAAEPSTIVLATGDAAEAEYSQGFLAMCERALSKGWKVEIVAFKHNISSAYKRKEWQSQWGGHFSVIELDEFVETLRL